MDSPGEISFQSSTISDNSLFGEGFGGVDVDEMAFPELDNSQNVKTNTSMNSAGLSIPALSVNSSLAQDVSSSSSSSSSSSHDDSSSPSQQNKNNHQNRETRGTTTNRASFTLNSRGKLVLEVEEKQNQNGDKPNFSVAEKQKLPQKEIGNNSSITMVSSSQNEKEKQQHMAALSPTSDISCDSNEYSPTKENLHVFSELTPTEINNKQEKTLSAVQLQIQKMEKAKKEAAEQEKEVNKKTQRKFTPKAASISKTIENRILQSSKMVVNNSNTILKQGKNQLMNSDVATSVVNINNTIQVNTVTIVDSTDNCAENENKNSISNNKLKDKSNSGSNSSLTKLHTIATADSFAPEAPSPYYKNHPYSGDTIPAHMNNNENNNQSDSSTSKSGLPNFANVCEFKETTTTSTLSDFAQEKTSNLSPCKIDYDNNNVSPFKNPLYDLRNRNRNKSLNTAPFNNNLPSTNINGSGRKTENDIGFSSHPPVPPVTKKIDDLSPTSTNKDLFSAGSQTVTTKTIASELEIVDGKTILDKKPPINKSPTRPARNNQNFKKSENYEITSGNFSVKELANRFKSEKRGSPLMNPSLNGNSLTVEDTFATEEKTKVSEMNHTSIPKMESPSKAEKVTENDTTNEKTSIDATKSKSSKSDNEEPLTTDSSSHYTEQEPAENNITPSGPSQFKDNSNGVGGLGGVSTARTNRARHRTLSINSIPSISKSGPGGQNTMTTNPTDPKNINDPTNMNINTSNALPNSAKMTAISSLPKGQSFNIYKTMDGLESPFVEEDRLKLHVIEEEKFARRKDSEMIKDCKKVDSEMTSRFPFPHTKEQQILEIDRLGFELYSDLYSSWKSMATDDERHNKGINTTTVNVSSQQHEKYKEDKGDRIIRNPLPPTDYRGPSLGNPRSTTIDSNLDSLANDFKHIEGDHTRTESGSSFVRTNVSNGKEEKEKKINCEEEIQTSDEYHVSTSGNTDLNERSRERETHDFIRPKSENYTSRGHSNHNNPYNKSHRQSVHYMPSARTEEFQLARIDEYTRQKERSRSRGDREREKGSSHRPSSSSYHYPPYHRGPPNGEELILRSVHDDGRERYHRSTRSKENPSVMKHIKKTSKDLLTFLGIMTPPSSTEQEQRRQRHDGRSSQHNTHHHRSAAIYDNRDIFEGDNRYRSSSSSYSRPRSQSLRPRNSHSNMQHPQRMPPNHKEKKHQDHQLSNEKELKKDLPESRHPGDSASIHRKKQTSQNLKEKNVDDDLYSIDPSFGDNKGMCMDRNNHLQEDERNANVVAPNLANFMNQEENKKRDDAKNDQKDETDSVSSRKSIWSIFSRKSRVSKSSISKSIRSVNRIRKSFTTYKSASTASEKEKAKAENSFHEEEDKRAGVESEDESSTSQTVSGSPTKAVNASLLQGCQRLIDDESGSFLKIVISSGGTSLLVDQFMESLVSGNNFEDEDDDFTEEAEIKNPKCKTLARALSIIIRRVSYTKEGRIELLKKGIMTKLFIVYKKNFKNRMLLEHFLATMLSLLKDQDEALFDVDLINESMQINKLAGIELDDLALDSFTYKSSPDNDQNEEDSKIRQVKKVIGAVARLQVPFNGKECLRNSLIHWNKGDTGSIMCKQVLELMAL